MILCSMAVGVGHVTCFDHWNMGRSQFQRAYVLPPTPLALSAIYHGKNIPQVATGSRMRDTEEN